MKKQLLMLGLVVLFANAVEAQKVKMESHAFGYEVLPKYPFPLTYNMYSIEVFSSSKDKIPLSGFEPALKDKFIEGFHNVNSQKPDGFIANGKLTNENSNGALKGGDFKITIQMLDLKNEGQELIVNTREHPKTHKEETFYDYKLQFKFPYKLTIKDLKTEKIVLDTLIDIPRISLFPKDYERFGAGMRSKEQLDREINDTTIHIPELSKKIFSQTIMNEIKPWLSDYYGYGHGSQTVLFYRVKDKQPMFAIWDTIDKNLASILDSLNSNRKNRRHLNWHGQQIRTLTQRTVPLVESMLSDPQYVDQFEKPKEKSHFTLSVQRDLVILYLLNDELDKAEKLLNEIEPRTQTTIFGETIFDETLTTLRSLLERERWIYNRNKTIFGFI